MIFRQIRLSGATAIFLILFMVSFAFATGGEAPKGGFDKIDAAFQAGVLSEPDMLFAKMTAIFAPQKLADQFRTSSVSLVKCGTDLVAEVRTKWDLFTPEQQSALTQYLARPAKQREYISPDGFFLIHYDTTGPEVVPLEDNNSNNVPDFVERIGIYCDSARRAYLNLGYLPAPTDNTSGGDGKFDIYLLAIDAYGATLPEAPADSPWNDYSSFIEINRNFYGITPNNDPDGDSIGAQKVTCVHEYFHAVQLAYNLNADRWWMEASATWMEEALYPIVQDNQGFLPYFLGVPYKRLPLLDGLHEYGAFVWPGFLQQKYDYTVIRKVFEINRYVSTFNSLDSALIPHGRSFSHMFPEFALWNYFTGARAKPNYYAQAASYPAATVDYSFATLRHDSIPPINRPDGLGCNYLVYAVDSTAHGNLEIRLDGSQLTEWALTVVASRGSFDSVVTTFNVNNGASKIFIPFIGDYDQIVAIPSAISLTPVDLSYYLSTVVLPYGDANYDRLVNVGDITYIINKIFKNGPPPLPVWQTGDVNCDGSLNVADAVRLINFVFKAGPAPCAGRR